MSGKLSLSVLFALFAMALSQSSEPPPHHSSNHSKHAIAMKEKSNSTKVTVAVYYESLCPDSAKFVTTQLYPILANHNNKSLAHHIDVSFVPFGKSNFSKLDDGTYNFSCHHGEEECVGNKYQACAIKYITDMDTLYKYINCTMATGYMNKNSNYSVGKMCADDLKVDSASLQTCADGNEGSQLLAMYGNQTNNLTPPLTSVPRVTVNGTETSANKPEALTNLKSFVCSQIPDATKLLPECATSASSVLGASFLMLIVAITVSRIY